MTIRSAVWLKVSLLALAAALAGANGCKKPDDKADEKAEKEDKKSGDDKDDEETEEEEDEDKDKDKDEETDEDEETAEEDSDDEETSADEEEAPVIEETPAEELGDEVTVETYPDQVPASGTVRLKKFFTVHNATDVTSKKLTKLGPGTLVDLKANRAQWMLIDWPSGIGEMSPGWIELASKTDSRVEVVQAANAEKLKKEQAEALKKKEEELKKKEEELKKKEAELNKKPPPPPVVKDRPKIKLKTVPK